MIVKKKMSIMMIVKKKIIIKIKVAINVMRETKNKRMAPYQLKIKMRKEKVMNMEKKLKWR